MLVKVAREKTINGAIPSKIYADGVFMGYGLESDLYKIPAGVYSAYGKTSPKFGTNKLYLNVPGRSGILFHGGNSVDDTRGCILTGKNRSGATVSGDFSDDLFKVVDNAYKRGENIAVQVTDYDEQKPLKWLFVAAICAGLFFAAIG